MSVPEQNTPERERRFGGVAAQYNRRYCVDRPACGKAVAAQLDDLRREANRKEQP